MTRLASAILGAALVALGCGNGKDAAIPPGQGVLVIPVEASGTGGLKYRLVEASFTVTSTNGQTKKTLETNAQGQELTLDLNPGRYRIELEEEDNYRFLRLEGGSKVPAEGELLSDPAQMVEVEAERESEAAFRFRVDDASFTLGGDVQSEPEPDAATPPLTDAATGGAAGHGGVDGGTTANGGLDGGSPPPDGGQDAGDGKFSLQACNTCLDRDLFGFNEDCSEDTGCVRVRDCVLESGCSPADGSASDCYCGAEVDVNDCFEASFEPMGACREEIASAFPADADNATILQEMAAAGQNFSGDAFNVVLGAQQLNVCSLECTR
jgi:hypothetical protein